LAQKAPIFFKKTVLINWNAENGNINRSIIRTHHLKREPWNAENLEWDERYLVTAAAATRRHPPPPAAAAARRRRWSHHCSGLHWIRRRCPLSLSLPLPPPPLLQQPSLKLQPPPLQPLLQQPSLKLPPPPAAVVDSSVTRDVLTLQVPFPLKQCCKTCELKF